jgi:hypothetical protein
MNYTKPQHKELANVIFSNGLYSFHEQEASKTTIRSKSLKNIMFTTQEFIHNSVLPMLFLGQKRLCKNASGSLAQQNTLDNQTAPHR